MISELEGHAQRVPLAVDLDRLKACAQLFIDSLFEQPNVPAFNAWYASSKIPSINLNHPAGLLGRERWFKHSGDYHQLRAAKVSEADFTVTPEAIAKSYFGEVMRQVGEHHLGFAGKELRGRAQLLWVKPEYCYKIHSDLHVAHRYHVPIITNPDCVWVFRDEAAAMPETLLHMPAEGDVWWLNPTRNEHTVVNYGKAARLHMLLTAT